VLSVFFERVHVKLDKLPVKPTHGWLSIFTVSNFKGDCIVAYKLFGSVSPIVIIFPAREIYQNMFSSIDNQLDLQRDYLKIPFLW
jgi:hypothetical protein